MQNIWFLTLLVLFGMNNNSYQKQHHHRKHDHDPEQNDDHHPFHHHHHHHYKDDNFQNRLPAGDKMKEVNNLNQNENKNRFNAGMGRKAEQIDFSNLLDEYETTIIHTEYPIEGRPSKSPVKVILGDAFYPEYTIGTWTKWEYCKGLSFIAGMQVMTFKSNFSRAWSITRIRFICETAEGQHTNDIYAGKGNTGKYEQEKRCGSVSLEATVGFGIIQLLKKARGKDCFKIGVQTIELKCLTKNAKTIIHQHLPYFPSEWDRPKSKVHYKCPPGTVLCGVRTNTLPYHQLPGDICVQGTDTHTIGIEFACCTAILPLHSCDAGYNWATILTCRKNLDCQFSVKTVIETSTSNSTLKNRVDSYSASLDTAVTNAVPLVFSATVTDKFEYKSIGGIKTNTAFKGITTTEQNFTVNMAGCDGSIEQLKVDCGIYSAKTKHFRCKEFDGWNR